MQSPVDEFAAPRLAGRLGGGLQSSAPGAAVRAACPRYKEEISHRLGVLVEQRVPFNKWTYHLQQAYYDQTDMPSWTLKHPTRTRWNH